MGDNKELEWLEWLWEEYKYPTDCRVICDNYYNTYKRKYMIQDKKFMSFWSACLHLAKSLKQKEVMATEQDTYYNYFLRGFTPEDTMLKEWG